MERESLTRLASLAAVQLDDARLGRDSELGALPRLASEIRQRLIEQKPVRDRVTVLSFLDFFRLEGNSTYRDLENEASRFTQDIEESISCRETDRLSHLRDLCTRLSQVARTYEYLPS